MVPIVNSGSNGMRNNTKGANDFLVPLIDHLYWIKGPGKGKFPFCNGFLIVDEEVVLIDAGIGVELIDRIDQQFHIDRLLISHSHPDHILFWDRLGDRQLMMPKETPDDILDLMRLGTRFTGNREYAIHWKHMVGDALGLKPMRLPDLRFENDEVLDFGKLKLRAIHAPGHLDDHYCFLELNSGYLLSTDIDFDSFGPWYGNPESSISLFRESIKTVQAMPYADVCSSHKAPMNKETAQTAFEVYLNLFEKHQRLVFDVCQKPINLEQMIAKSPFYRDRLPDKNIQYIFEKRMIEKNLELLLESEKILNVGEGQFMQS